MRLQEAGQRFGGRERLGKLLVFIGIFAAAGTFVVTTIFAAGSPVAFEPESGTLTSCAVVTGNASASAGSAVKFTPCALPKKGIAIAGWRLMQRSDVQLAADLDAIKTAGGGWLRFDVAWNDLESSPGQVNWPAIDRLVNATTARGIRILGILGTIAPSVRPGGTDWTYGPKTNAERSGFANFAAQAATRYAGKIDYWEIWNEPNLHGSWSPQPSAADYTNLLMAAYPAIKSANPNATVLAGGAGWGQGAPDLSSTAWWTGLYAAGAKPYFDAGNTHPYYDYSGVTTQEMGRSLQIRQTMDSNGDTAKLLWGTETGAATCSDSFTPATEAQQATFVTQSYDYWFGQPGRGPLFQYTLNDYPGTGHESCFGLQRLDGSQKPSYNAYKNWQ